MVENIFILDRQKQVIKMLTLNGQRAFFDDLYTQELSTGTETFEFSTNTSDDIIEGYYVMFKYNENYKLFQIIEIQQEHDEGDIILTCYCEGACLELLNKVVKSFSKDMTPKTFLEYVLFDTTWEIGNIDPLLDNNVQTVTLDKPASIWKTIQNYANVFGYEIDTRVIYENKHVKKCYIDLYSEGERGNYLSAKRFEYGRNVNGIVKRKDLYEWCTAMVIANATDGILDVHFNQNGYNKGIGSDTITANIQNELYNNGNDYIYGVYDGDGDSAQEVVSAALKELQRRSIPRYDYEVTTALTYNEYSNLHIGDTVRVIDHTFTPSLLLEARVSKLELSFSDRTKCSCTLSNYKEMTTKIAKAQVEQVDDYTIVFTKEAIVVKTDLEGNFEDVTDSDDILCTTVNIYKTGALLTAVAENPTIGQYTVAISDTLGCTASLQSDNKTIKVETATSNSGKISVVLNIEGKQNYGKSIPVAAIPNTNTLNSSIGMAQTSANNAQTSANNAQTSANNAQNTANEALDKADNAMDSANTAGNSAQQALEAANAADTRAYQALQKVDIGATNWDAAYNNVVNWASGSVSSTTTIDGGKIAAGTITANAIKSDAISGKDISGGTITGAYILSRSGSYYTALNSGYIYTNNHIVFEQNSPGLKGTYSNGSLATICHVSRNDEMIFGYGSYDATQSGTAYNNGTEYRGGAKTILKSKGSVWLGCNDGIVNSTGGQSIIYVYNSAGEYTFRSNGSGKTQLGYSNMPWKSVHSNSFNNTSDRTFKKDIKYISNANTISTDELTIDECYNFIKNEVPIATYKYKEDKDNRTKVGFIAQDLLCDANGKDCKVGQLLMTRLENSEEGEKLGYDINNALGIMMAAMQAMARKIETLENEIKTNKLKK